MVTDREETDIAVLFVGRQDVKDCCHVGFIERQLIGAFASTHIGR